MKKLVFYVTTKDPYLEPVAEMQLDDGDIETAITLFKLMARPLLAELNNLENDFNKAVDFGSTMAYQRLYQIKLLVAAVENQKSDLERQLSAKVVLKRDELGSKDFKFLGTNEREVNWSLASLFESEYAKIAALEQYIRGLRAQASFWELLVR